MVIDSYFLDHFVWRPDLNGVHRSLPDFCAILAEGRTWNTAGGVVQSARPAGLPSVGQQ